MRSGSCARVAAHDVDDATQRRAGRHRRPAWAASRPAPPCRLRTRAGSGRTTTARPAPEDVDGATRPALAQASCRGAGRRSRRRGAPPAPTASIVRQRCFGGVEPADQQGAAAGTSAPRRRPGGRREFAGGRHGDPEPRSACRATAAGPVPRCSVTGGGAARRRASTIRATARREHRARPPPAAGAARAAGRLATLRPPLGVARGVDHQGCTTAA